MAGTFKGDKMKKLFICFLGVSWASSAYAADIVVVSEPVAPVVPDTFSWTGGYIGINAGYAGGKFKHPVTVVPTEPVPPVNPTEPELEPDPVEPEPLIFAMAPPSPSSIDTSVDVTSSGFIGGIQAGYNWQFDRTVIGIETDIQASNLKGEISGSIDDVFGFEAGSKINWLGTTRVRVGYLPTERFMLYATGGVAYGQVKTYGSISGGGETVGFSNSKTRVGYTVGAGAEYAFTDHWTLKSEYLYTDLGKTKFTLPSDGVDVNVTSKTPFHTIRVGVNYKF